MDNSLELALRDLAELRIACLQAPGCEPEHVVDEESGRADSPPA